VGDWSGDAVLVPADAFVFDGGLEAVFIGVEAGGAGFHFDEEDFKVGRRMCALSSSLMCGFAIGS